MIAAGTNLSNARSSEKQQQFAQFLAYRLGHVGNAFEANTATGRLDLDLALTSGPSTPIDLQKHIHVYGKIFIR